MNAQKPKVLLGVTGSVATIKIYEVVKELSSWAEVRVVTTVAARHFFSETELEGTMIYKDENDWHEWQKKGDPVLHIELRRWADVLVIAPLSANSLAKMANGMSDNLLMCIFRAWDFEKPLVVAPAMNTFMFESPFTKRHLRIIKSLGVIIIPTVDKKLACGDVGFGAMASPIQISKTVQEQFLGVKKSGLSFPLVFICLGVLVIVGLIKVKVQSQ
eukprot:TRINITY_DN1692_c0_g1_i1.p2 TRINITY_DN1692_c0_g1~~TRINITY_DN1692_c0_g1_i1.p2  ORF type:complete len:216 (+),score=31.61 TRINITY_DN1692_c0_g1_i1:722-1369(+)